MLEQLSIRIRMRFFSGFFNSVSSGIHFPARTGTKREATRRLETSAMTMVKIMSCANLPNHAKAVFEKNERTKTQIVVRFPL